MQPWAAPVVHISAAQVVGITAVHSCASPSETRYGDVAVVNLDRRKGVAGSIGGHPDQRHFVGKRGCS